MSSSSGTFTLGPNRHRGTNTTTYNQPSLFSFNLDTGLVDANFRPTFGGGGVQEVEASPDGTKLFVTGSFNTVNGVTKQKIASINPITGATVQGFTANANSQGTAIEATNTTVYVGGMFSTINGDPTCRVGRGERHHGPGRARVREQHHGRHRDQRRPCASRRSPSPTTTASCSSCTPAVRSTARTATRPR